MKRAEILEAARVCVCGERERDYGTPENNFETVGLLWGVYLRAAHPELAKVMAVKHRPGAGGNCLCYGGLGAH